MFLCQVTTQWAEEPFFKTDSFLEKRSKGIYKSFYQLVNFDLKANFPRMPKLNSFYSCFFNEVTEGRTSQDFPPDAMVPVHKF